MRMICGSYYWPKEDKLKPEGDDAHFICAQEQTIGVADGVGGWAKHGVDAGQYARELTCNSIMSVQKQTIVDPRRVLNEAYADTKCEGSSTACIVTLRETGVLHFVNVGDSGLMVFRNYKLLYMSPREQRSFNCPYQLGNSRGSDNPCSATEIEIRVFPGDIVVLGTDGLWDNMYPNEIEQVVLGNMRESRVMKPQALACLLADLAWLRSLDKDSFSPYSKAAQDAGKNHPGGKMDDITVVVGHIMVTSPVCSCVEDFVDRPLEIIWDNTKPVERATSTPW
ncbi:hypothetical protein PRUPE_4G167000 [Prunus persica]|uniref:Protein phosphatase n=1 Tax=Prunus persica TaxID=3760 RepID=A0A251PN18_PRUPE|nr:probable protein phosphatase 2C 55 [Prunus persica]ONI12470.1 hypothetical protein PRUPE_4G167000 [Prunus persica]